MALAGPEGVTNEYRLDNPPKDCIQNVRFGPVNSQHLLVSSWDCSVRLYDVTSNLLKIHYTHSAPVLDATFQGNENECCWSGSADHTVKRFDLITQTETLVGSHDGAVRCVEHIPDLNLVITGGWDSQIKFWDPRQGQDAVATHKLPDKVYAMCPVGDHQVIVGTAGRRVFVWDARNMTYIKRESSLKYQTRCIKAFPDQKGYVLSSIEGRVSVEYLDQSPEVQKQKYAFKCHRNKDSKTGMEIIYPVNAISFHKKYGTFATGGSDGYVNMWDAQKKKRLQQFHQYPTSISSLSFSPDGSMIAIASSYLYENDEADHLRDIPGDSIFIRRVTEKETRPM